MDAMQKLFSKKGGDTNGVSSWKKEVVQGTEFTVPSSYTLVKKLGSGAYGTVAAFEDKAASPPRTVAVKLVKSAFNDLIDAKRIVREVKLLRHFEHDNVVSILDIFPPDSPDFEDIYIIMDLMDTDLHRVIYSNQSLTNEHIQYFLYQLLRGLKYVHSANVVHRDLKPSNILVNRDCELKICDFGLSRGFEEGQEDSDFTHYVVTRWYRAPEVILTAKKYTRSIDIWSVGCILAETVARKPLFQGNNPKDQIVLLVQAFGMPSNEDMKWIQNAGNPGQHQSAFNFVQGLKSQTKGRKSWEQIFPHLPKGTFTRELEHILDEMLQFDPDKRCSVKEALEMEYLKDLHDPKDEPECEHPVDWSFDNALQPTKRAIQLAIYGEAVENHPHILERDAAWFQKMNVPVPGPARTGTRRTRSNTLAT